MPLFPRIETTSTRGHEIKVWRIKVHRVTWELHFFPLKPLGRLLHLLFRHDLHALHVDVHSLDPGKLVVHLLNLTESLHGAADHEQLLNVQHLNDYILREDRAHLLLLISEMGITVLDEDQVLDKERG